MRGKALSEDVFRCVHDVHVPEQVRLTSDKRDSTMVDSSVTKEELGDETCHPQAQLCFL